MSDKRKAMVEEILEWMYIIRNDEGRRPTQQEIDDFIYSWQGKK